MNDPEIDQAILRVRAGSVEDYQSVVVAYHRRLRLWLSGSCPPGVEPDEITHVALVGQGNGVTIEYEGRQVAASDKLSLQSDLRWTNAVVITYALDTGASICTPGREDRN